jgi:K+-transporting ATPase KdpC subunit
VNITQGHGQSGGNMTDKEVRFGIANTALWATATTDASNGSVNGGHDALTPSGGAVPLVNIFVGEVIFGGVGSGLYGMFFYILIAVFVAGLMVGRTPEYLGKKIEAREIKYAAVGALFVPTLALALTAISVVTHSGLASIYNSGAHGFTEALYAYTSQANNNGSAFAGDGATCFSAYIGAIAMLRDLKSGVIVVVVITMVFGLALPALFTGFAQVAFSHQANGSLITVGGEVVGSRLDAQAFMKPQYFHERPSATAPPYNGSGTTFANLGPRNPDLAKNVAAAAQGILKLEGPYNPGLTIHAIPVDAVTTSASGLDPDISPAYAHLQSRRVAAVRHLPVATVERLIRANTDARSLGFLGEPGVNVLELNIALDKQNA